MAEIDVLKAQIVRDSLSVPWGFRLQGGADFGQPLTILRITPGSPAARIGLKSGDEVTEIGDVVTRNLSHDQASAVIAQYGQSIILTVERRARGGVPTHPTMNPAAGTGQQPGRPYDMYDVTGSPNQPQLNPAYQVGPQSYHTASARPFESPALPKAPPPPAPEVQPEYRPQPQPGPPSQQYSSYKDDDEEQDPGLQQSRTFKILQSLMENDGEPPPPVLFARKAPGVPPSTIPGQGPGSHPKVIANRQFNSPIGLYDHGVAMDTMGQKMDGLAVTEAKNDRAGSDPSGPKPYIASETMRLVKQLDEEKKKHGRPSFSPPMSSKPPVGRVLDESVPSKPSPGGAYVPNYQKSLAHVIHSSNEQVRNFSMGIKEPMEENECRLSTSKPPDSLPGYRKVEPPQSSPLTRSVKSESPTPTPYIRPVAKVESFTPTPFTRTVKTESPMSGLLTRPIKVETTTPTPFTRMVKTESPTPTPFTPPVSAESPTPTPYVRPVKAESPTPTPYVRPVKAESPIPAPYAHPVKTESPMPPSYVRTAKAESPTATPYVRAVKVESPTPTPYGHPVKAESSTPYGRPVKAESPTQSPFSRTPNSHSDSGYQTPTSLGSPMHINATSTESEGTQGSYPYLPVSSSKTPETQTHTFTSSMVVNTSRAQIKLPSSFNSSSSCSHNVGSSAPAETKVNTSPAPSSSSSSSTIVSHSASSSSSSSATSGSYFIPATGLDNPVPVSIATAAATSSIIEAALKPKVRAYKKADDNANQFSSDISQAMVTVSPQYKMSEPTTSASTQKETRQQIVVDEPGFPMATITMLMPEGQHGSESETSSSHGASGRSSPWYQPSHSQSSSSYSPQAETVLAETKPGTFMIDVSPRATITIPKKNSTLDRPAPEPCTNTDVIILNEGPRATIKIPSTFRSSSENKVEPAIPKGEIVLSKASTATVKMPDPFQSTSPPASETIKQQPQQSIIRTSTTKVDPDPSGTKRLSQTSTSTVTLNEAPRKTIRIPGKIQQDKDLEQKEKIEIAASSKGKFQKLTSMFQSKEQESQKTIPGPKRTLKIPSTFKQPEDANEKSEKPVRKEPIKLPSNVNKLPGSVEKISGSVSKPPCSIEKIPSNVSKVPGSVDKIPASLDGQSGSLDKLLGSVDKTPGSVSKLPGSVDKLPSSVNIQSNEEKHNKSNGTVSSHTSHTFQPVSNGRPSGFRSVKPPQAEQTPIVAPVPSYMTANYPDAPTSPDMPPPEFPPPPPPPESPPPFPPATLDLCSEFPLPPPPHTDCPGSPTTPDLPPPPAIAAAPEVNQKEDNAKQLYAKYADLLEDKDRGPIQSRTFNTLSNMVEGEPEPAAGVSALPRQRSAYREQQQREAQMARTGGPRGPGAPRVKVFMPQQYNTPLSMYSAQNVVETFQGQAEMQLDQLEHKHPDVISGAQRAVLEEDSVHRATSDF